MKERFRDDYVFSSKDRESFMEELAEIQAESTWMENVPGSDLRISSVQPIEVVPLASKYGLKEDVLTDTASPEGTQLLLHIDGNTDCLRQTAYAGLLQTAVGITGPGVGRLWKRSSQIFCESLNEFLKAQGNSLKLYRCCDKISGVFSSNYQQMEVATLITTAETAFVDRMGEPLFEQGYTDHALSSCSWEFPDTEQELIDQYQKLLTGKLNAYGANFSPLVSMVTSNTGASAATLTPMLTAPGRAPFRVGRGVRIRHDNRQIGGATGCGMEAFKQQAGEMFTLFTDGIEAMSRMADHWIKNPQNAFIAACNWAFGERLPRKLASNALEDFMTITGGNPCTMYDIFIGISDINTEAEKANLAFDRKVEISENIAKLFSHKNWSDFDLAGQVAWNGAKGGVM